MTHSNPLISAFKNMLDDRKQRMEKHRELRESEAYKGAIRQIDRYLQDYGMGVNAIEAMATRHSAYFDERLSLRLKPHFVQSMIAAVQLIKEGFHDPAKRELRFLVEAAVKALSLDQGAPTLAKPGAASATARPRTVAEKTAALDGLGRERFDQVVDSLSFGLLDAAASARYKQCAKSLYGSLSTTTHVSSRNIERDLTHFESGKHFGFESVAEVNAIAKLLRQVLDLALASHFEAFDHGLIGDIFEPCFDPKWSFLKMPLVSAVNSHFDYKHERRVRRGEA